MLFAIIIFGLKELMLKTQFINSLGQFGDIIYTLDTLLGNIYLIIIFCLLLYGFIKVFIPFIKNWNYDRKKLKKLLNKSSDPYYVWTKEEISNQFLTLRTSSGRLNFIEHLEEKRIKPPENSEWPDGNLPNIDNDKASTLLAKLEERWLGLNR